MGGMEGMVLFVTSRVAEFAGILITIYLMFKGYKAKYAYIVGTIVLLSITISLLSLVFREYFLLLALGDILFTLLVLLSILIYVIRNPEKTRDFTPPEEARCLYCNAYITSDENLCVLRISNRTFYLDSLDHLKKLMKEIDFIMERGDLPQGKVAEAFVKLPENGEWKKLEDIHDRELQELFNSFKDRLGRE